MSAAAAAGVYVWRPRAYVGGRRAKKLRLDQIVVCPPAPLEPLRARAARPKVNSCLCAAWSAQLATQRALCGSRLVCRLLAPFVMLSRVSPRLAYRRTSCWRTSATCSGASLLSSDDWQAAVVVAATVVTDIIGRPIIRPSLALRARPSLR